MAFRINRCRAGDGFTAAANIGVETRPIEQIDGFTAQLVELAVGDKQRFRQHHINVPRVVQRLPEFSDAVMQLAERFFSVVRRRKLAV